MPRFLAWETGWIMMMPFTKKKKEQQVWGEAWEEDEFSFGHVVFKKPRRLLREEVELGIWIYKSESHERSGWRNTCEADSPQLMFGSRWECTGRVYKTAKEDSILRNSLRERILQRDRLSGQRSRRTLTVKCFGSQGKRAFKKERTVSSVQYYKEIRKAKFWKVSVDLVTRSPLLTMTSTDWMEW